MELLLELYSEEIPSLAQISIAKDLSSKFKKFCSDNKIEYSKLSSFYTARRITLFAKGFSKTVSGKNIEKKGPKIDANEKAIQGFAKSNNIKKEQLEIRETKKGDFYFYTEKTKSEKVTDLITKGINEILPDINMPKSMRWGDYQMRWIRPLKNILCIFDSQILPVEFGHIKANNKSFGHSILNKASFTVENFTQYESSLKNRNVVLDQKKREEEIIERANKILGKDKKIKEDQSLLKEVVGLVESPNVFLGKIDEGFMSLPEEILISSIKKHQKYFCVFDNKNTKILPYFIAVSNNKVNDQIVDGNQRVLKARLADAEFFFSQDKKTSLFDRKEKLKNIIYYQSLGTVYQKSERVKSLAKFLSVWIPHSNLMEVERAADIYKSDLTTEMVDEFPDLQGIMGYYYAKEDGESDEVAQAIKEHYKPQGNSDNTPKDPISIAISLADKIDTLSGMFIIGKKPTGSKDPFALRRAAIGLIRIIIENNLSIPLKIPFLYAVKQYPRKIFQKEEEKEKNILKKLKPKKNHFTNVVREIGAFLVERLISFLKDKDISHDVIDAVISTDNDTNVLKTIHKIHILQKFITINEGKACVDSYKRINNILKKDGTEKIKGKIHENLLGTEEEKNLFFSYKDIEKETETLLKENKYEELCQLFIKLKDPLNDFFDNVMINVDDKNLKQNRLKLLLAIRKLYLNIGDFSKLEG